MVAMQRLQLENLYRKIQFEEDKLHFTDRNLPITEAIPERFCPIFFFCYLDFIEFFCERQWY